MADVFISYKRRLRPRVAEIAAALEQLKVSVWFDAEIEPGKSFGAVINRELAEAKCVLVCWTPDAFAPEHGDEISWVEAEATKGREKKILVPVLLEQTMLNAPWNMLQTENLVAWAPGSAPTGPWLGVLAGIGKFVERPGLADYVRASADESAADLTRWAQTYPNDPLAADVWERITEFEIAAAKARVVASRTSGQPPPVAAPPPRHAPPPQLPPEAAAQRQAAETPPPQPASQPAAAATATPSPATTSKPWRGWALALLILAGLFVASGLLTVLAGEGGAIELVFSLLIAGALFAGGNAIRQRQK
jgi:hypothetical protein